MPTYGLQSYWVYCYHILNHAYIWTAIILGLLLSHFKSCLHMYCHHTESISRNMYWTYPLQCRQNGRDSVSNHQPNHCLLNGLFGHRSKKISKLRVTGLCAGNSPVTGEFPPQMASNAENVSIWWRHHASLLAARWCRQSKSCFVEDDDPCILHSQYHGHWWPGDARSQYISSRGINLVSLQYSGFTPRRVNRGMCVYVPSN